MRRLAPGRTRAAAAPIRPPQAQATAAGAPAPLAVAPGVLPAPAAALSRVRPWLAGVVLAAATLAAGCTNFDDVTTVKDLRVLAVNAQPPAFLVDIPLPPPPNATCNDFVFTSQTSHMQPLVADPGRGGRPLCWRAVACPNTGALAGNATGMPGSARGTVARGACPDDAELVIDTRRSAVADIAYDFTPSTALIQKALCGDPLGAVYGLPLAVETTVWGGGPDGDCAAPPDPKDAVVVDKRVIYSARLAPDDVANGNPLVTKVASYAKRGDAKVPLADDAPASVALGATLFLEPDLDEALTQRESYLSVVRDRTTNLPTLQRTEHETLRYAFFATAGTFSPAVTSTEPLPIFKTDGIHLESTYNAPAKPPADPDVTVWIVVRDERGGQSWTVRHLRVE